MTEIFEHNPAFENATKLDYEKGYSPDQVYAGFCKMLEATVGQWGLDSSILKAINHIPLILFDVKKANRTLEWIKTVPIKEIRLPFKSCSVADPLGVVCLRHCRLYAREDQSETAKAAFKAIEEDYRQRTYTPPDHCLSAFFITYLTSPKGINCIGHGDCVISYSESDEKRLVQVYKFQGIAEYQGKFMFSDQNKEVLQTMMFDSCRSIGTTIEQLIYMSQPGSYVLMETPKKVREKSDRPIRAHERSRIRVFDPEEMREVYLSKHTGSHKSPLPHLRMGHWRTFKAERFSKMKGQMVWIDEIQVRAGEEWEHENKIYKVMERKEEEPQ